jgi:hypothetical protein
MMRNKSEIKFQIRDLAGILAQLKSESNGKINLKRQNGFRRFCIHPAQKTQTA